MSTRAGLVIVTLLIVVLVCAALAGCAEDRYLSKEQDAEMKSNCGAEGCVCMPTREWQPLEQLLRRLGLWRDA